MEKIWAACTRCVRQTRPMKTGQHGMHILDKNAAHQQRCPKFLTCVCAASGLLLSSWGNLYWMRAFDKLASM